MYARSTTPAKVEVPRASQVRAPRYADHERVLSATPCQPAVRSLVLEAYLASDGMIRFETYPVLALVVTVSQRYSAEYTGSTPPRCDGTPADLAKAGWVLDDQSERIRAAYLDHDGVVCYAGQTFEQSSITRLVACDWPSGEDEARLAEIRSDLADVLQRRLQR